MDGEATGIEDDPFAQLRAVFAGRRALLLEDDPALSEHVAGRLLDAGFEAVERVESGEAAIAAATDPYDVLILDRLTAGLDGLETLKRVRAGGGPCADAPALMLTALGGERQKVEGLLGGADDYLSKPVGDEELLARIAAQLRRAARRAAPVGGDLVNGPFRLSFGARTLKFDLPGASRLIDLSPLEFAIVCELMTARGQPVTKTMLWDRCWVEWRFLPDNFVNIIDARISALRRRLKEQASELGDDLHPLIVSARSQSLIFRDLSAGPAEAAMAFRFLRLRAWLGRRTTTQLAAGIAVMAAVALTGSLMATSAAVRMDQREKAALAALDDYSTMVEKLGAESSLTAANITEADAAYLSAWLSAFQDGPTRDVGTIEETCSTGRGGAGVRFIRAPVGKPAGLSALETTRGERVPRLGDGVFVMRLDRGVLCPSRAVEVVVVRRSVGVLNIAVGRVVDRSGDALGWAVVAVAAAGVLLLAFGLTAATFARRRLTSAVAQVSRALDLASVGDFSVRAPETAVAPELTELTGQVNLTLDRLEELLSWLRDSADQLAHDFRTPLARASARLDRIKEASKTPEMRALAEEARADLTRLTRAMNEAMALRDGEAWVFETVRLDRLAASAAELYQPLAEERAVVIRVEASAVSVLGVRSLLQRAVTNLVDNAVKFSPEGGVVTLTVRKDDGKAALSVADQGPGMDPDLLDDPARAVSQAAGEGRESHGMGLAFVRSILKRHGAVMTIDDAGPGAVVTAHFSR